MTLKERIIEHLKERGTYDEKVDNDQVDNLLDNIKLSRLALKEIKTDGILISTTSSDGTIIKKMHPAVNIYQMFQKNIHQCSSKLGLNRMDRLKLKIIETEKDNEFDELMSK